MSQLAAPATRSGPVVLMRAPGSAGRWHAHSTVRYGLVVVTLALALFVTSLLAGIASGQGHLPGAFGPPTAAAAECVNGWRELDLPTDEHARSLFSVVTHNGQPKYLLGGSHRTGMLALRKIDGDWKRIDTKGDGTRGFTAGSSITGSKTYAVGYSNIASSTLRAIGGRLTGKGFRGIGVPSELTRGSTFTDVVGFGSKKAWTVGTRWIGGRSRGIALRWNGQKWRRLDPKLGSRESALTAAHAAPGGKLWAVGWKERSDGEFRPVVLRRNSGGWKTIAVDHITPGISILSDVHFAATDDGWITGYVIERGTSRYDALLQHWDGSSWTSVPLPWADSDSRIVRAVTSDELGNVWLAGVRLANGSTDGRGFVASRIDDVWTLQELDVPGHIQSDLRDIALTNDGAIAVGGVASTTFAMETCAAGPAGIAGAKKRKISVSKIRARNAVAAVEDDLDEGIALSVDRAGAARLAGLGAPVRSGSVKFADRARAAGIYEKTKTWGGVVSDVDDDGWRDIWLSRHLKRAPRMLMGSASGFSRAPGRPWTIGDRHGCDAADIDKDGARDIFCAFGGARGTGVGRHEVALRAGKGDAEVRRNALGAHDPFARGRTAVFVNLNNDGYPDLYVTNNPLRVDGLPGMNRFFRNVEGRFVPAPRIGLDHSTGAACVWAGDIDADGDGDILHCQTRPSDGRVPGLRLYRNEGGTMRDRTGQRNIKPMGDIAVAVADVDRDGRRDLIQLSAHRLRISRQTNNGFVRIFEAKVSNGHALATGDVNGDGFADIYLLRGGNRNPADRMLINTRKGRAWKNVKIPVTRKGTADAVLAIDYDKNGRTDFVVLNGGVKPGPIQLIAAFKR